MEIEEIINLITEVSLKSSDTIAPRAQVKKNGAVYLTTIVYKGRHYEIKGDVKEDTISVWCTRTPLALVAMSVSKDVWNEEKVIKLLDFA